MLAPVALTGCPDRHEVGVDCAFNPGSYYCDNYKWTGIWEFNLFGLENPIALSSAFDVSQVSADFSLSSSNVSVTTNSGYATVKLTLSDNSVVANAFSWVRQGDQIFAQNPSAVNNWIDIYRGDIAKVEVNLGGFSGTGGEGPNTLVGQAMHAGTAYAGGTYSWYVNPNHCDPATDPYGLCDYD